MVSFAVGLPWRISGRFMLVSGGTLLLEFALFLGSVAAVEYVAEILSFFIDGSCALLSALRYNDKS
ncbi:hypothetical protein CDL15_Pgr009212 [Punica granatum]|uniref:Uncharacterized protein n=1 Tax=Punica granatum TaxID=22663 RepID=A0A218WUX5_PUNGR|nr:hypothetical protein CDL15_Pgr009212 [Punica granatum]